MSLRSLAIVGVLGLLTVFAGLFWWSVVLDRDVEADFGAEGQKTQSSAEQVLPQRGNSESATIEVIDYGFGQNDNSAEAIVIVEGTVSGQTAELVTASVNFLDADGVILATETGKQYLKWDGHQLAIPVTSYGISPGAVASIDPTVVVTDHAMPGLDVDEIPAVESVEIADGFAGDYMATFMLTNNTETDWMDITVGVACYGESEEIIGGGGHYPGPLLAGKSIRMETNVTTSAKPSSCKAFAHPALFER